MFWGPEGGPFPPPALYLPPLPSPPWLAPPPSLSRWATHLVVGSATSSRVGSAMASPTEEVLRGQSGLSPLLRLGALPLGCREVPWVLRLLSETPVWDPGKKSLLKIG